MFLCFMIFIYLFFACVVSSPEDNWGDGVPEDFPRRMVIKPSWNRSLSPELQHECLELLNTLPQEGPFPSGQEAIAVEGRLCALMIIPSRGSPDMWERIFYTTQVAIELHVGSIAAGWDITLYSGVRIHFGHMPGASVNAYIFKTELPPDPSYVPRYIPPTEDAVNSALQAYGQPPVAQRNLFRQVVRMSLWALDQIPLEDCENVITHLTIIAWFVAKTGWTLKEPWTDRVGRCSIGIYLTFPHLQYPDPRNDPDTFGRTHPRSIKITDSAKELMRNIVQGAPGGGYINLPDGLQICLYEGSYIDPQNICGRLNRVSLSDCLQNRAQALSQALFRARLQHVVGQVPGVQVIRLEG